MQPLNEKSIQSVSIADLARQISMTDYLRHARDSGVAAGEAIALLLHSEEAIASLMRGNAKTALRLCRQDADAMPTGTGPQTRSSAA